jgi:hypothetical protein
LKRKTYLGTFFLILTWSVVPVLSLQSSSLNISSEGKIKYYSIEFGFSVHETPYHATNWTKQLLMVNDSGAKWVRSDIWYDGPSIPSLNGYQNFGLKLLGIIDEWTIPPSIRENFTLDDWKNIITEVATKFRGTLSAYEIWSEPDSTPYYFGYMDGTPQHYVDMLREAYSIIKSIDPTAIVLGGAIADPLRKSTQNFTTQIFELGASNYMDAFSIHLYYYDDWNINYGDLLFWAYGLSTKPIWVTETGECSGTTPPWIQPAINITEEMQAKYMKERYDEMLTASIKPRVIIWYDFYDSVNESWCFGVVSSNYTPKLAYYLFKNYTSQNNV